MKRFLIDLAIILAIIAVLITIFAPDWWYLVYFIFLMIVDPKGLNGIG